MIDGNAKILIKRLYKQIEKKIGNLKDNSLLLTLISIPERKRSKLLRGNILSSNDLDLSTIKLLIDSNLCKKITSSMGEGISITAQGIYEYEKDLQIYSLGISFFEKRSLHSKMRMQI